MSEPKIGMWVKRKGWRKWHRIKYCVELRWLCTIDFKKVLAHQVNGWPEDMRLSADHPPIEERCKRCAKGDSHD